MALRSAPGHADDGPMNAADVSLIRDDWFSEEIAPGARARLQEMGHLRDFAPSATIVAAGAPSPGLGVILEGRVALRVRLPGATSRTILTLEDGDLVGWSAILPGSVATATATALTPTRVMLFERDRLADALAIDCEAAAAVLRLVVKALARRLQATRLQLLDVYGTEREPW